MTNLSRRTLPSPRFECTTLCYYEGDTFVLLLPIELTRNGELVTIAPDDVVTLTFLDVAGRVVAEASYTGIRDNIVQIDWDAEMTARFGRGSYSYRIRYNGEQVTTIAADCRISVQ